MKQAVVLSTRIAIFFLGYIFYSERAAYAYLDPGSGSILLQILLGGFAGIVILLKLFWQRFLSLFGIIKKEKMLSKSQDDQ